jgi:DDE family transposase
MPKKKKSYRRFTNPDFRARTQVPAPPVEDIVQRLRALLTPAAFAPLRISGGSYPVKRRDRLLTLPVMTAIVVSLVLRQIPSLTELLRVLAQEGLLWVEPMRLSKQALSARLARLPARLFAHLFNEALSQAQPLPASKQDAPSELADRFTAVWLADGSTLEALRRKLKELKDAKQPPLAGKMLMIVEGFTRRPVKAFYTDQAQANDKAFSDQVIQALPVGGLLVVDLGFFSFPFFDSLSDSKKYFVTRMREKTSYEVVEVVASGKQFRDEIIRLGKYRSNPCRNPVRMVSVEWGGVWYRYLTNVLRPEQLSARLVCELYRRRWRIEEAFLVTKRLLGLSYLWVGTSNGVEIQVYATWIFYAVLVDLCAEVSQALQQPIEKISVEMVFRSLYHYSRAVDRGDNSTAVEYLVAHAKLFGLVKAERKRHKEHLTQTIEIWDSP